MACLHPSLCYIIDPDVSESVSSRRFFDPYRDPTMKFGLRTLLVPITLGTVLLAANLRVSPAAIKHELYPEPAGIEDFFVMRGWPLSPCWFGTYGVDGLKEPIGSEVICGVWFLNVALAVATVSLATHFFVRRPGSK